MAQSNRILVIGIGGLLPRIMDTGEIPDVYFSWATEHRESVTAIEYEVQGYTFYLTKESVPAVAQHPPYIRYKLQCNSATGELTVHVTCPEQATLRAVRLATWAAFRAIIDLPDTTYFNIRDARGYIYAAQTTTAFH